MGHPEVIIDIGGNQGEDVLEYSSRFADSKIITFEPIPQFYDELQRSFEKYSNVEILNIGVSDDNRVVTFHVDQTSSSGVHSTSTGCRTKVCLRDIHAVLEEVYASLGRVDVVSINCEGCEYAVLQRMSDK